jgi:acetylornithine deacetylase/succinyl-diaminopimelate desuccinylase-like protein
MEASRPNVRIEQLQKYYQKNWKNIEKDYFDLLRFQSISSEAEYQPQIRACASWVVHYLEQMGFSVELWESEGHPVIFAAHLKAGHEKPTVLIYNHYDVQPVDPLELWESPPFEPTVKNGNVFARGAQDNKGQLTYVLQAIKALIDEKGELPVNLKLCIEGEEEMGSVSLMKIAKTKQSQLKADHLFIVDLGIPDSKTPAITLGIRGILAMTVEITGSFGDLHSGDHGGVVYNPNRALAEVLGKLHDSQGKVSIPGFYDDVLSLSEEERNEICFDFDEAHYESSFGAKTIGGEKEFSPLESSWIRPTCEINGISGGYAGTGFKTVIPAKAMAKISCRLVPNQDPEKVFVLVEKFFKEHIPTGMQIKIEKHHGGGPATRTTPQSTAVLAVAQAYTEVFNVPCKFIMAGGTISVVTELRKNSGANTVMFGMGLSEDQIHAPNEHFGLERLEKGFLVIARSLELLGAG